MLDLASLPILQAPMAGVQGAQLALAVCDAGGLGPLPGAMLAPEDRRREMTEMVSRAAELTKELAGP